MPSLLVRCALSILVLVPAAAVLLPASPAVSAEPTLRTLAAARGMQIGTAVSMPALEQSGAYRDKLRYEFNSVTPENAMKWSRVEPQRGAYEWGPADDLVELAEQSNQTVRGHTLVWHGSLPGWLTGGTFTDGEVRAILKQHIEVMVGRYAGRVAAWDVVNEPFNEDGSLRDSFWLQRLGPGYIAEAFHWARAADPEAKLYLNDYATGYDNPKRQALYNLVRDLRAQGVPIDGVGFQTHEPLHSQMSQLRSTLQLFADLGLDVAITELDVRMELPVTAAKLATQAERYARATAACVAVRRCMSLTVWGFTDAHSWVPGSLPGWGAAHLLDESYQPKPAYDAVHATLANRDFTSIVKVMHSLRCLHSQNGNNGTQLVQWGCWETDLQRFDFHRVAPSVYTISNTANGKCLMVRNASTASGAAVVQGTCANRPEQRFELRNVDRPGSDHYYRVVAVHSGHCLHVQDASQVNGGAIVQAGCSSQRDHQLWRLDQAPGHR